MICSYDNAISVKYVNKIIKIRRQWDTLKNIEAEEKWVQKKDALEKKIRKSNFKVDYFVIHPPPRTLYPWLFFE